MSPCGPADSRSNPAETHAAMNSSPASAHMALSTQRRLLVSAMALKNRPPKTAPTKNAASETSDRPMENPGAPETANARKTTLPVMFAVNTWPSARTLTASTRPVTSVSTNSAVGIGSFFWSRFMLLRRTEVMCCDHNESAKDRKVLKKSDQLSLSKVSGCRPEIMTNQGCRDQECNQHQ